MAVISFKCPNCDGELIFDGENITDLPSYKRQVNTIFQRYALFPHLNVFENIAFGLRVSKTPKDEITERVEHMLEIVNLKGFGTRKVQSLSGGQQQRVAIARALVNNPKVLLLDEPTAALDPIAENEMYQTYRKLTMGNTSIFISHRLSSTGFCDQILLLDGGVIKEQGTHAELLKQGGLYAEMFEAQSKYYKEKAGA